MRNKNIVIIFFMFVSYAYIVNIINIPERYVVNNVEDFNFYCLPGIKEKIVIETSNSEDKLKSNNVISNIKYEYSIFGIKNIKETIITKIEDIKLIPVGELIGLKLYTNGVLVVGTSNVENINNEIKVQEEILEGDTIVKIDNYNIDSIDEIKELLGKSNGNKLSCTVIRNGECIISNITPIQTGVNEYKLGLWVKDAATGVGTISFYNKEDKSFIALGHGITDGDTGKIIDIDSGEILLSDLISISKGESGIPGEIKGSIVNKKEIGKIYKNTSFGIMGEITSLDSLNLDLTNEYEILIRDKIKTGKATILCELDEGVKEYDIKIKKIYLDNNYDNKSMVIEVIDEELLNKTGGIIRGMSGSPILQDGKIVGIVTNVLISDPKIGYGVFMDLVLNEM